MSYQNENFGMMDQGYFVPRTQILDWINSLLNLTLNKIQQLGSGAVYCQIVDVIHPGKVSLPKLNWKAKNDYQFISNLKILQNAFDKIGIKRHVEVERLAKAKYQDNLEFIQWLKRYFDLNCGERGNNYMADQRRGNAVIDFSFAEKNVVPKTYNGSGAVVKSQAFDKKKPSVKIQESTKKPTTTTVTPSARKAERKQSSSSGTNTSLQQKIVQGKKNQMEAEYVDKIEILQIELERSRQQKALEAEKSQQATLKIEMIREVLKSQDGSELKINLIQQLLKQEGQAEIL